MSFEYSRYSVECTLHSGLGSNYCPGKGKLTIDQKPTLSFHWLVALDDMAISSENGVSCTVSVPSLKN
jgi:hypothetical protein